MSIEAVKTEPQAVGFSGGEDGQKKGSGVVGSAVAGAVVAGVPTYFFWKKKVDAPYIRGLEQDKFEKQFGKVKTENEAVYTEIAAQRAKDADKLAEAEVEKMFGSTKGKEAKPITEMTVEDFLKKEGYADTIKTPEQLAELVTAEKAKTEGLQKAFTDAETELKNVAADAADDVKAAAQGKVDEAKRLLKENVEGIAKGEVHSEVLKTANEGKISRDVVKGAKVKEFVASIENSIKEEIGKLGGKEPKMKVVGRSLWVALGGAVLFGLIAAIKAGNKNKTQAV